MRPRRPRGAAARRSCACPASGCRCANLRRRAPARSSIAGRAGMRPAALGLGLLLPAVEGGTRNADGLRSLFGGEPGGHGSSPSLNGVASSRGFDIWGLRREKTRRRPTVSDNMRGQAKNLHGGLLELVDSQLSASETPFFHSTPSHIFLNPDRQRFGCHSLRLR